MSPGKREPRNISELDPNSFGAQLRKFRIDAGLSQEELGDQLGLDQARISSYERNQNVPKEDLILRMAEVLNIPPTLLFEASMFRGVLPIGPERRERLQQLRERDWRLFDEVLETMADLTPEQRQRFEQTHAKFLREWEHFEMK